MAGLQNAIAQQEFQSHIAQLGAPRMGHDQRVGDRAGIEGRNLVTGPFHKANIVRKKIMRSTDSSVMEDGSAPPVETERRGRVPDPYERGTNQGFITGAPRKPRQPGRTPTVPRVSETGSGFASDIASGPQLLQKMIREARPGQIESFVGAGENENLVRMVRAGADITSAYQRSGGQTPAHTFGSMLSSVLQGQAVHDSQIRARQRNTELANRHHMMNPGQANYGDLPRNSYMSRLMEEMIDPHVQEMRNRQYAQGFRNMRAPPQSDAWRQQLGEMFGEEAHVFDGYSDRSHIARAALAQRLHNPNHRHKSMGALMSEIHNGNVGQHLAEAVQHYTGYGFQGISEPSDKERVRERGLVRASEPSDKERDREQGLVLA